MQSEHVNVYCGLDPIDKAEGAGFLLVFVTVSTFYIKQRGDEAQRLVGMGAGMVCDEERDGQESVACEGSIAAEMQQLDERQERSRMLPVWGGEGLSAGGMAPRGELE